MVVIQDVPGTARPGPKAVVLDAINSGQRELFFYL